MRLSLTPSVSQGPPRVGRYPPDRLWSMEKGNWRVDPGRAGSSYNQKP
jgi:hypothetical protein